MVALAGHRQSNGGRSAGERAGPLVGAHERPHPGHNHVNSLSFGSHKGLHGGHKAWLLERPHLTTNVSIPFNSLAMVQPQQIM